MQERKHIFGRRVPALPSSTSASIADGPPLTFVPVAVEPSGGRAAEAPAFDAALAAIVRARAAGADIVAVLDHAGPRAASWSLERAWGASDDVDVDTGRRARPLDAAGWDRVMAAYAAAAVACARAAVPIVLGVDDDGLLHSALRVGLLSRVLAIHRGCGAPDVALAVEDLAPGGLDATDGIATASALAVQGARIVLASGGSRALTTLRTRVGAKTSAAGLNALASAGWLVDRVDARIVAAVPAAALREELATHEGLVRAAMAAGLAGVVVTQELP